MSLSNTQLDALLTCAQTGQFTRAAKILHVTQSALSQRIAALETEIGSPVLIRNRNGVQLTPAGETLLRYCRIKDQLERETLAELSGIKNHSLQGKVRITGYSSVMNSLVLKSLAPLAEQHPELTLELKTLQIEDIFETLETGRSDFVLLDRSIYESGLGQVVLGYERNVLVQKKGYQGLDIYLDHNENDRTTLEFFRSSEKTALKRHYLGDINGLIEGVRLGMGKAVLPLHLVARDSKLERVANRKLLEYPIVLYFLEGARRVTLFQTVISTLTKQVPLLLKQSKSK